MSELNAFTIPLKGLKMGMHQYEFEVDDLFFKHFEASPIKKGKFLVQLFFDKRPDMLVLTFDFKGRVKTACDRCLAPIDLPVQNNQQLLFKFAEEEGEDAEVVFISRDTNVLNVARYIYEFICLSLPIIKVYDCESEKQRPCNMEMLKYLTPPDDEQTDTEESIWDELKNFKKNN